MTRDEFIAGYCSRSNVLWAELSKRRVALQCACGESLCSGWAMVSNNEEAIADHMNFYDPRDEAPNVGNKRPGTGPLE